MLPSISYLDNWKIKEFDISKDHLFHREGSSLSSGSITSEIDRLSMARTNTSSKLSYRNWPNSSEFIRWNRIQNVKNRLSTWRAVTMGLSLLALILISSRLYSICKEVKFLQFVSNEWLPKQDMTNITIGNRHQVIHVENLRQDIDILIIELWYSRTTLILGVVFVFAYIMSWGWMTYVMEETARNSKDVSLKSVLLLVIFAAVDIAASTGFIMVRIIMGAMSNSDFPRDMRQLSVGSEHDQLAAFVTLRMSVLQSSCGTTDIFISGLVALLTAIRVYILVCVVSFYNKIRKDPLPFFPNSSSSLTPAIPTKFKSLEEENGMTGVKIGSEEQMLKMNGNYTSWSKRGNGIHNHTSLSPEGNRETFHKEIGNSTARKYSVEETTSMTGEDEDGVNADDFKIQAADMPIHMQRAALHGAIQACRLYTTEKLIAESIKQDFDQMFTPTWHCIVGRNWGSCVTHSKQCYIRILYKDLTILLYKST